MTTAPRRFYRNTAAEPVAVYDVRDDGAAAELHRMRAVLQEAGDLEALDEHHFVLSARPLETWDPAI